MALPPSAQPSPSQPPNPNLRLGLSVEYTLRHVSYDPEVIVYNFREMSGSSALRLFYGRATGQ
ncbi:hypothetical protein BgiBS90_023191, partial [Biomphalaria glabrata]